MGLGLLDILSKYVAIPGCVFLSGGPVTLLVLVRGFLVFLGESLVLVFISLSLCLKVSLLSLSTHFPTVTIFLLVVTPVTTSTFLVVVILVRVSVSHWSGSVFLSKLLLGSEGVFLSWVLVVLGVVVVVTWSFLFLVLSLQNPIMSNILFWPCMFLSCGFFFGLVGFGG